jgi:hypothetical protein
MTLADVRPLIAGRPAHCPVRLLDRATTLRNRLDVRPSPADVRKARALLAVLHPYRSVDLGPAPPSSPHRAWPAYHRWARACRERDAVASFYDGLAEALARAEGTAPPPPFPFPGLSTETAQEGPVMGACAFQLLDLVVYEPRHQRARRRYIFLPTGDLWSAKAIDQRCGPTRFDPFWLRGSQWLRLYRLITHLPPGWAIGKGQLRPQTDCRGDDDWADVLRALDAVPQATALRQQYADGTI